MPIAKDKGIAEGVCIDYFCPFSARCGCVALVGNAVGQPCSDNAAQHAVTRSGPVRPVG